MFKRLRFLILVGLFIALPAQAQESGGLLDSLFGGGEIRENIVYREPLGNEGEYEATVYGSRVQGTGYLEITLVDAETGEVISGNTEIVLRVMQPSPRTYTGVYQNGYFLFEEIDFPESRGYDLQLILDYTTTLKTRMYVYPSAPDNPPAFALGNILVPIIFLVLILGGYMLFKVQYLPEPRKKNEA